MTNGAKMTCSGIEKYYTGKWTQEQFQAHIKTCAECRTTFEKDKKLLNLSRSLKKDIQEPFLWNRSESDLLQNKDSRPRASDNYQWFFKIAALLVIATGIGLTVYFQNPKTESGLLAQSALEKVQARERQYEAAIEELEETVLPQMSQLDQELMLLYRDRLETIDQQIEQCKEALAMNPANAHIRRYLLAALRDKKETLKELMSIGTEIS